ncbi:MAG: hypothetical protein EHJ94_02850 [Deltaproteobacteria bacterium]|nr:MAG: hypothetical protein EHJ94_02850 [Deltaproteobacteria bacterium]
MMAPSRFAAHLRVVTPDYFKSSFPPNLEKLIRRLDIHPDSEERLIESLPFSMGDATAGTENELQTVVIGKSEDVDLPIFIRSSNFFKNTIKYATTGDAPRHVLTALERHLTENTENKWENSWVRFPKKCLNPFSTHILTGDLRSDKKNQNSLVRKDSARFFFIHSDEPFVRIPISYMLKLALADSVGDEDTHPIIRETAEKLMNHFLNDNTSPETFSFHVVRLTREKNLGKSAAAETLKRFLLTQLLTQYANRHFQLIQNGQQASVYFAPQPPLGQKKLNNLISDAFYRELFMSPCLSGWDQGEEKMRYMGLCHRTLSLSQLNAVAKLKESGIITRNLVVLPNTSNTSLANNGTHISLGSRKLSRIFASSGTGMADADEKYIGDLVIKITEHFLPLFVGTYSAAPYRFDFWDFHPEKMLGFLPHELDFTHLRMMWRRWRKKASTRFLGRSITPFGPEKLDRFLSRLLLLKGDFVTDVRLIDYLVALLSTSESPCLNGMPESDLNLKKDLSDMGVFDESMPLYMLYRLRRRSQMGFSGFEGRYYSLFEDIQEDMGSAANLQLLLTLLAYKLIFEKKISHSDIPDHPTIESERRQIFFGTAIGIPTFYVRKNTRNRLLISILQNVKKTRPSRRYNGYIRVLNIEYRKALIELIRKEAGSIIEMLGLKEMLNDLEKRITEPDTHAASGKLTRGILEKTGSNNPMKLSGEEFNSAAENYYRTDLKKKQIAAALNLFQQDVAELDSWQTWRDGYYNQALLDTLKGAGGEKYLAVCKQDLLNETSDEKDIKKLIHLMLLTIHKDLQENKIN